MEYWFNQFSRFAHFFVGQTMQSLIPSLILTIAVAALLHFIKGIDAAIRYKSWLSVLAVVIVLPLATTLMPFELSVPEIFNKLIEGDNASIKSDIPQNPVLTESSMATAANHEIDTKSVMPLEPGNPVPVVSELAPPLYGENIAAYKEFIPLTDTPANGYSYRQMILEGFPLIALMLWLLIFLVMIFRIVLGYRGLEYLKASTLPLSETQSRRVERLSASPPIRRRMMIRQSDRVNIPVSAGFIRPMVIMPSGLTEKLDDRELQAIIVHEMAHLARYDDWMKLTQKILTALFFFNPVVFWIGRRLDLERELACDAVVLDCIGQPRVYARCLTKLIQRNTVPVEPTLVTGAMLSQKQIFRRIEMIMNGKLNPRPLSFARLVGLIVSIFVMAILVFQAAPALAWPYHPFKFSVIAEVIKEKTDSSTATVFRSEKSDKWRTSKSSKAPLLFLPDDKYLNQLDTARLLEALEAALENAELITLDESLEPLAPVAPLDDIRHGEPAVPDDVSVPGSERRFKKSGDYIIYSPVPDDNDFIDSKEGAEYLQKLAESNAKYAEKYGEAVEKYKATMEARIERENRKGEAAVEKSYAKALARTADEGFDDDAIDDILESVGNFIETIGDDDYTSIKHDDDGSLTYEWKKDSDKVRIEIEGEFKLNDDDNEIIWMADDALVEIYERKAGTRREVRIEPGVDGEPLYVYRHNGKTREFDAEAREWYHQIMADCVRKTGFNAAERSERIYEKEGLDGVLREIEGIESDYVARLYLGAVIDNFDLTDDELGRVIRFVTRNVDSDYEKAELLLDIAAIQKNEKFLLEDFILAAKSLASDYERRRVLSELSLDSAVSTGVLLGVLEIAETMGSDYERAQLLVQISDLQRDDEKFRYALIRAIGSIGSDYERSRVIQKLLEDSRSDSRIAVDVLELIAEMTSDYEKSKLLIYLAGHTPRDKKLFDAYLAVIASMSSDYEVRKSLMALGPFYDVNDSTLLGVLNITEHIGSDYERSQILKEMIGEVNRGTKVRRALLQSVDDIGSDYESSQLLSEIIGQIDFKDDDAARDILVQIEQISSDYEKAKVLSELIPSIRGREVLEDDLADVIETIGSEYERNKLYAELYRNTRGKR